MYICLSLSFCTPDALHLVQYHMLLLHLSMFECVCARKCARATHTHTLATHARIHTHTSFSYIHMFACV